MTPRINSDFFVHYAAPPKGDKHRSNPVIGKAAYAPRLPDNPGAVQSLSAGLGAAISAAVLLAIQSPMSDRA